MFAIKSPSGFLLVETTSTNRAWAWHLAYEKVLHKTLQYAYSNNPTKAAYANGWRCVEVEVTEKIKLHVFHNGRKAKGD